MMRRTALAAANPLDVQIEAPTFFDDFTLSDQGVSISDYPFGGVRQYDTPDFVIGSTPSVFDAPVGQRSQRSTWLRHARPARD
jgi:hypothetical protein